MGQLEEKNKELARVFLDALSRADAELARELYAEDFQLWTAGSLPFSGTSNKAEALEGMKMIGSMFPDGLQFTILETTAEGDRVAIEAESKGVAASGVPYHNLYHFLMVVRDGRIHRFKEYMDTMHANEVLVESMASAS